MVFEEHLLLAENSFNNYPNGSCFHKLLQLIIS